MDGRLSCRGPGNPRWRPPSPEFPSASGSWEKPASAWSTICASASADWRAWSTVAWPLLCPGMRMRLRACRCRNSRSRGRNWRRGAKGWGSHPMAVVRWWHSRRGRSGHPSAGPPPYYADLAQRLAAEGAWVWIIGGPGEKEIAAQIVRTHQGGIRDLTGPDLRNAILALAAANAAVSNDSGLLHVAAALGTPAVGIFGPTSPWHWAPLNPIAAVIETTSELPCRPCHKPVCRLGHHLCMRDISVDQVSAAIRQATLALPAAP